MGSNYLIQPVYRTVTHAEQGDNRGRGARSGYRNDLPDLIPYVWNIGEKLRRAMVAAELREARQRALEAIRQHPDQDTDPLAIAAVIERYGLEL